MRHRQMGRQTHRQMNRSYFIGPVLMSFDHNFQAFEHKIFWNYLT